MSKPSAKKTLRQNGKHSQKQLHHTDQQSIGQTHSYIPPTFPGEQIGIPMAGYRLLGQIIASFLRRRKP